MSYERFNAYKVMWLVVFFDLPTETKRDRKNYSTFRKNLLKGGFTMFQFSIYTRHCLSKEHMDKYKKAVKKNPTTSRTCSDCHDDGQAIWYDGGISRD